MAAHNRFARLSIAAALLVASAVSLYASAGNALAQPRLAESDPRDGASIAELPKFIRVCFSETIDFEKLPGGFSFAVIPPDGTSLGLRTEWQTDSKCAHVFPGRPAGGVKGEWTFQWTVASVATGQSGAGSFRFNVTQEASPAPSPSPGTAPKVSPGGGPAAGSRGGGPDVLELALLTVAAAAAAAVIGLVGYLMRRRIGYFPHRPSPREGGDGTEHH